MSGLIYAAVAPATVVEEIPPDWQPNWDFPGPPWPPGWPIVFDGLLPVTATAAIDPSTGTCAVTATVQDPEGADAADLDGFLVRVRVYDEDDNLIDIKKTTDAAYSAYLLFWVSNYTGSSYGFSDDIVLDTAGLQGKTLAVVCDVPGVQTHNIDGDLVDLEDSAETEVLQYPFVAVGALGKLAASYDGETWNLQTSSFVDTILCVCLGNVYVAGGDDGAVATSPNGIDWTQKTSGFGSSYVRGVAFGNDVYVIVGDSGKLAVSADDGETWNLKTSGFGSSRIYGVCYGDGVFVAVGDAGKLSISIDDGETWNLQTSSFGGADSILSVIYGAGLYVAAGEDGKMATSPNGVDWTQRTSGFGVNETIYGLAYGDGKYVCVGKQPPKMTVSSNGIEWTQKDSDLSGSTIITGVIYRNNMYVAVANLGGLSVSADAETWESQTSGFELSTIYGIA